MEKLIDILGMRRAHNTKGEEAFIKKYIAPMGDKVQMFVNPENEPIAFVVDMSKGENPAHKVMWSCHIDTVHKAQKTNLRQKVFVSNKNVAYVGHKSDCLGADDGAGVWLLLEMIEAGVKGTYVFHRGEERGCWGSRQMASNYDFFLKKFTHAIAFDRKGTHSIITHQSPGRCCSDKFGRQFASFLNMGHELDDTGLYTDTAEYVDFIHECVNVSCGYYNEHSNRETLDMTYLKELRDALCQLDLANDVFLIDREAGTVDPYDYGGWNKGLSNGWGTVFGAPIDNNEVPTAEQLQMTDVVLIEEWVIHQDTHVIAELIANLADRVYTQTPVEFTPGFDDDDDTGRLDVGLR